METLTMSSPSKSELERMQDEKDGLSVASEALSVTSVNDLSTSSEDLDEDELLTAFESRRARVLAIVFLSVFVDAGASQVLGPNYAIMVSPDSHPDSFPSTAPFDFATANYFIPMVAMIGTTIANLFVPHISDKIGRRTVCLANLVGTSFLTLVKYFVRSNYWLFCGVNFLNGLASSTPAVALSYISDLYRDDRKKSDLFMGNAVAVNVIGRTLGAMLTIAMKNFLFLPLIPAAAVVGTVAVIGCIILVEPNRLFEERKETVEKRISQLSKQGRRSTLIQIEDDTPSELHQTTLWNIIVGSMIDTAGSCALVPMCLSPMMFQVFLSDFQAIGEDPVMSEQAYRWIYTLLALSVVPAAVASSGLFAKFGPALCCVVANLFTGPTIIVLMIIAFLQPVTGGTLGAFVTVLYVCFPLSFISQLSIGPMLDRIAPSHKRGYVQGLNLAVADSIGAIAPFLYGLLADNTGLATAAWTGFGVCILAAIVNTPLIFNPRVKQLATTEEKIEDDVADTTRLDDSRVMTSRPLSAENDDGSDSIVYDV